jgi:hypothetical protein
MLKLKVREIAEAQGITDPVALAGKTKVAYATAYRLWQGQLGSDDRGVGVLLLYRVSRALDVKFFDLFEEVPGPMGLIGATT